MKFKETKYGDLTNKVRNIHIILTNPKKDKNIILTSLEGSPKKAKKMFDISYNKLTSLKYCPEIIEGNFNCSYNELTSLEYSPKIVKGDFYCSNNKLLTSLKGSPEEIGGEFQCHSNLELTSLEGSPKLINKTFNCGNNPKLKNTKEQIIKYQIKAKIYWTNEGSFEFKDIEEEFNKYRDYLLKKEKELQEKLNIKTNKLKINNQDYGYSIC